MKDKDLKILREKLYNQNKGICPLLQIEVPFEKTTLDHIHKLVAEEPSEQKGTIRNTIEFRANAMEGKITNNWKRNFGSDESKHPIPLPDFLRNLADYLEQGAYSDENGNFYIHSTEAPKPDYVKKTSYNKLAKVCKTQIPPFNAKNKQKLTKELERLFVKYDITIEYYKS